MKNNYDTGNDGADNSAYTANQVVLIEQEEEEKKEAVSNAQRYRQLAQLHNF